MSNLLGIIDILDDDGDLRLDELSAASVSAVVDAASPVIQSNWIPFSNEQDDQQLKLNFQKELAKNRRELKYPTNQP